MSATVPARREPAVEGLERQPRGADRRSCHLRRHRRSRPAQADAGALHPRAQGAAARALRPRRRLAQRQHRRGLSRGVRDAVRRFSATPRPTRTCCEAPRERLRPWRIDEEPLRRPERVLDALDRERRRTGTASSTLDRAATSSASIVEPLANAGSRRARRAVVRLVIEKPFGHDLAGGARAQPPVLDDFDESADLPHRPLPRQGDRAEHAGVALRQRHLRADLEPPTRRPRADHGRRVDRDRGSRRLLRAGRGAARRLPEPPAAADRDHRDGAAGDFSADVGAQREGQGAALDPRATPDRRRESCAASTAPGFVGGEACRATVQEPGVRPESDDRDVRRALLSRSTTGAGPTRPSTCGSASGSRARRRSRSSSSAPRTRLLPGRLAGLRPNAADLTSSPTRAISLEIGAKMPGQG